MTGSPRAVRKTSLPFDLPENSLTYPMLLKQLVEEVSLLFLRSPVLKLGAALPPKDQPGPQAGDLPGLHPNSNTQ